MEGILHDKWLYIRKWRTKYHKMSRFVKDTQNIKSGFVESWYYKMRS